MTVVVVGDVATDVVVVLAGEPAPGSDRPASISTRGGGAAANVAAHLARLGTAVELAGCVGDDPPAAGLTAELTSHQVALLDGVMQGVRALLDELSPAAISDATEHKRGGLRIGGRQKEAWDEYCERYEQLSDDNEVFSRIFGQEFADAYRGYRRR